MTCCTGCTCTAWARACAPGCAAAGRLLKRKPGEEVVSWGLEQPARRGGAMLQWSEQYGNARPNWGADDLVGVGINNWENGKDPRSHFPQSSLRG